MPVKPIFPPDRALQLHYRPQSLAVDFAYGFIGLSFSFWGLFLVSVALWLDIFFGFIGLLFIIFVCQTVRKSVRRTVVSVDGIEFGGRYLAWSDISHMSLRHYGGSRLSVGRRFFALSIEGCGVKFSWDSGLSDFTLLVSLLWQASVINGCIMDEHSVHNCVHLVGDLAVDGV